jgi:hypothetical protein
MKGYNELIAFNRGQISPLALARADVKRVALSAETQQNWMPRVLGSMMLRPGLAQVLEVLGDNKAINIPFVFNNSDTAILEFTDSNMRPLVNEAPITRISVSTAVTNGTFSGNITGWTSADGAGASSTWVSGNYMGLTGTGSNSGSRKQTLTLAGGDSGKEHALRIVVARHIVTLRVGNADGDDSYINQVDLRPGTYSLAFTPTTNIYIQLSNVSDYQALVQSVAIEGAGAVTLPTPWLLTDLPNIRWDTSADVIFVAVDGYQQRRIERHSVRSWGIALYIPIDGPFNLENTTQLTLTPSAISGDITLTASSSLFRSTHVGALFSITSTGQNVSKAVSGANQWSDPIRVIGVGTARTITLNISGTWMGTVRLQSSVGAIGAWADVPGESWTINTSTTYADGLDNQIIFYRIGIDTGEYTSGTANVSLTFAAGSITGIVKITAFSSSTSISASVLIHLGSTAASSNWSEGAWSDYRGWPTADAFFEGRLWWAGRDNIWGSISNAYESFDATQVGDAGPISSGIGSGPVDIINWILPLLRLLLGGQAAEHSVRSSSLDEPLTPTNFAIKQPSSQGSTNVPPVKMDLTGFFVNRTGTRLFDLTIENAIYSYDYGSADKTLFCPEIISGTIVRIAIQRIPETRIHCVLSDGTAAVLVYDPLENVQAWVKVVTTGTIEDVFVMPNPGMTEDKVYYSVKRTINSVTKRYLERWALENECQGGTLNKQVDCHQIYSGSPTTTISTGLANTGMNVWADGKCVGGVDANANPTVYTTDGGGTLTLPVAVSNAVYGIPYTAPFKSSKLSDNDPREGTGLTQKSRVDHMSLIMYNTHYQGLKYGTDLSTLDPLPLVEDSVTTPADTVWPTYDHDAFEINDIWSSDTRICLQAQSPLPCTVLGAFVTSETNPKI